MMYISQMNKPSYIGISCDWGPVLCIFLEDIPQHLWDKINGIRNLASNPCQPIPMALPDTLLLTSGHHWLQKVALTQ